MIPITFALIAYLAWGSGDIFGTIAVRRLSSYSAAFWSYFLRIIVFSALIPFMIKDFAYYTPSLFFLNLFLGLILLIGFLSFNQGLKVANPSIVGTISASFVALVVIFSILFLGDFITLVQGAFIAVILFGVVLTSLDLSAVKIQNFRNSGIFFALMAMFFWGIYFTFIKIVIKEVGWFWPNYISFTLVIVLYLASKIRKIELPNLILKKAFWPTLGAVLLTGTAEFCFNYALQKGYGSIVAPIAGAYPTLFVLLSFIIFREPLTKQQKIGIAVSLVGITALSISSQ